MNLPYNTRCHLYLYQNLNRVNKSLSVLGVAMVIKEPSRLILGGAKCDNRPSLQLSTLSPFVTYLVGSYPAVKTKRQVYNPIRCPFRHFKSK